MAEGTGEEAGEVAVCPSCGREVKQHSMIPVLAEGGGVSYLCTACARAHLATGATEAAGPTDTTAGATEAAGATDTTAGATGDVPAGVAEGAPAD